jgi:hypothetical protein
MRILTSQVDIKNALKRVRTQRIVRGRSIPCSGCLTWSNRNCATCLNRED